MSAPTVADPAGQVLAFARLRGGRVTWEQIEAAFADRPGWSPELAAVATIEAVIGLAAVVGQAAAGCRS